MTSLEDYVKAQDEAEAAEELLTSSLTQEEVGRLMGIRHELNAHLMWKRLAELSLHLLQSKVLRPALIEETDMAKRVPFLELFKGEQEFLQGDGNSKKANLRKTFVMLKLLKKLLGALKTGVNRELEAIRILTSDEEDEVRQVLAMRELDAADYEQDAAPEAETDLETDELDLSANAPVSAGRKPLNFNPVTGPWVDGFDAESLEGETSLPPVEAPGEIIVRAKLHRPKRTQSQENCSHYSTRIEYPKGKRRELCRSCGAIMDREGLDQALVQSKADPCKHPSAVWVEGQEGKVAQCGEEGCGEIIPNPGTFRWRQAGLEPYLDDPDKDEVIVLNEEMQE